jgi:hypothetical protein
MRVVSTGVGVLCLLVPLTTRATAEDQADAKAIVERAIKAAGGEKNLARFKAHTWNEKGTYYGQGKGQPFTGKYAVQWPGQFRMEIEGVFTLVVDGDKGWLKSGGETTAMPKEMLAGQQGSLYGGWVSTLLPLAGKEFTLATLPAIKIDDRPAMGVKVTRKGYPDVQLYFDKGTGLLAKSEFTVRSEEEKGKQVKQESFFSAHKEIDGTKIPMKMVIKRDGKVFLEAEHYDMKPAEKLDAKVFAKP